MVARLDRAHAAPGWSAPGREPGRRGVVWLPRGPADGRRHGVVAHRHGGRARKPARRPVGSAGEGTDLVAHLAGFAVGALLGASVALPRFQRLLDRVPQWLTGAAALASLGIAWSCAL